MSAPAVPYQLFVGIDSAAASASVACATDPRSVAPAFTIAQTPAGFADLVAHLRRQHLPAAAVLVVLEATNTYWMSLALHLHDAGYAVSVINPAQAHQFAKALLKRAKTDAIDAQTLAQLAATLQPKPWTPPPAIYEKLRQRLLQRENLIGALTQERNRLDALRHRPTVIASVWERSERWIAWCETEIATLDAELTTLLDQAGNGKRRPNDCALCRGLGRSQRRGCWWKRSPSRPVRRHSKRRPLRDSHRIRMNPVQASGGGGGSGRAGMPPCAGHCTWRACRRGATTRISRRSTNGCARQASR